MKNCLASSMTQNWKLWVDHGHNELLRRKHSDGALKPGGPLACARISTNLSIAALPTVKYALTPAAPEINQTDCRFGLDFDSEVASGTAFIGYRSHLHLFSPAVRLEC
jgi:hypothetical protein